ncbi:HD domain-containing protein [Fusibacter bizertensis]|jgi:Guanosine polyphosphate pyrophosphohydrolases/synthetases|uniref:HD domain-containing protein n=1 Tax=Fusibacter bizertensis TaxID=1488331 RepID=A0ABT6NBC5_9FIRM|nr:HD domain-containing protein [Fusibacter bizertensis]MDH8677699.1 HD domain-containing protein [Fusibacter bizertensis]
MLIYNAIHTAIKAHEGQIRKLDQDIYVAHPIEVGITLAKHNLSDEVIIAGILHDTVEDTPLTLEDIKREFGPIVALYVKYCSETNKEDSWKKRKLNYLANLSQAPMDVLYIVCVDKLTNIKSIYRHLDRLGEPLWDKFNAGYEDQKWYYTAILDLLRPIADHPLYAELEHQIAIVFNH